MFTIGEFSRITGLTVKTLRFYHEEGLLEPTSIDDQTGYRYYDASLVELARTIAFLKSLDFSLAEIEMLLATAANGGDLTARRHQRQTKSPPHSPPPKARQSLDDFLSAQHREGKRLMTDTTFQCEEKTLPRDEDRRLPDARAVQRLRPRIRQNRQGVLERNLRARCCFATTPSTRRSPTTKRACRSKEASPETASKSAICPPAAASHSCMKAPTTSLAARMKGDCRPT